MDLKIDGTQFQALMLKAAAESLGEVGREAIVKEALRHLTEASYGRNSPLQNIIYAAAEQVARDVLIQKLTTDPQFIADVEKLYTEAYREMMQTATRESLIKKLADSMASAITPKERY